MLNAPSPFSRKPPSIDHATLATSHHRAGGGTCVLQTRTPRRSAWTSLLATVALTSAIAVIIISGDSLPITAQSNDEYPPVKNCLGGSLSGRTRDIVEHVESVTGKACADIVRADLQAITTLDFSGNGWKQLRPNDFDGFTELLTLNLSNNQITAIPENALFIADPDNPLFSADINTLQLQNNKISTIHPDAFDPLAKSLITVNLNANSLTTLPNGLFEGQQALRSVNLSDNFIDRLPSRIFSGIPNFRTLSLGNNLLTSDSLGFLSNAATLFSVTLNNNRITSDGAGPMPDLPSDVFANLTTVRAIHLNENAISVLPNRIFAGLTQLEDVRLNGNRLTTLHDGLFNGLTSLELLTLQNNRIESLPAGLINGQTSLCQIWLHENRLDSLPAGFYSDYTLTQHPVTRVNCEARLYDNEFSSDEQNRLTGVLGARAVLSAPTGTPTRPAVPGDADNPETLANCGTGPLNGRTQKVASLIFNRIPSSVTTPLTGLPADDPAKCSAITTEHLTLVTTLNLSGSITSFQANDFADLPNLKTLGFNPTTPPHVTNLPAGLFDGLSKVYSLSLSNSWIQTLPTGIFDDLTNLKFLILSDNLLSSLPSGVFRNQTNLRTLFLQRNQLNSLPAQLFANLGELRTLGMTNNQLDQSDITSGTFEGLNNLRSLYLENNNFRWLYVDRFIGQGLDRLTRLSLAPNSDVPADMQWRQFRAELPSLTYLRFQPSGMVAEFDPTPTPGLEATPEQTPTPTLEERLELPLVAKIEPSARSLTVAVSTEIRLSVELYDLQDVRVDSVGDNPWFTIAWDGPDGGSFSEPRRGETDGDGIPDDQVVQWRAPDLPGKHTVTATVMPEWACDGEDHECTATFNINTIRSAADPTPEPTPCPTSGIVPTSVTDTDGNAYSVITPAEGGEFLSEGATITVPTGALAGCNPIGIRAYALPDAYQTAPIGWTTAGSRYRVEVADVSGNKLPNFTMRNPASVCVPLPAEFRASLSGITLLRDNGNGAFTQLTSSIRLREAAGATLCGNVSTFPADVVAAGPTAATASEPPSPTPEATTPDAGATTPTTAYVLLALALGAIAVFGAMRILDARRPV